MHHASDSILDLQRLIYIWKVDIHVRLCLSNRSGPDEDLKYYWFSMIQDKEALFYPFSEKHMFRIRDFVEIICKVMQDLVPFACRE